MPETELAKDVVGAVEAEPGVDGHDAGVDEGLEVHPGAQQIHVGCLPREDLCLLLL